MYLPKDIHTAGSDPMLAASNVVGVLLIGACILYLIPPVWLLAIPFVSDAIGWVEQFIPSIRRWAELSPYPLQTKLFLTFVWAAIPVQSFLITRSKPSQEIFLKKLENWSIASIVTRFFLGVSMVAASIVVGAMFAIVDTPPCRVCVNTERWALLLWGCAYAFSVSGLIALCAWDIVHFFKIIKSRKKES